MIVKMMVAIEGMKRRDGKKTSPIDIKMSNRLNRPFIENNLSRYVKNTVTGIFKNAGIERFRVSLKNDKHSWNPWPLQYLETFVWVDIGDQPLNSDRLALTIRDLASYTGEDPNLGALRKSAWILAISMQTNTAACPSWLDQGSHKDHWPLYRRQKDWVGDFFPSAVESFKMFEFVDVDIDISSSVQHHQLQYQYQPPVTDKKEEEKYNVETTT